MYIPTGDVVVEYGIVDPYWGHCDRVRRCRYLLETLWYSMALLISTGYVVVEYGSVDINWGRCGRVWHCRSLLGRLR